MVDMIQIPAGWTIFCKERGSHHQASNLHLKLNSLPLNPCSITTLMSWSQLESRPCTAAVAFASEDTPLDDAAVPPMAELSKAKRCSGSISRSMIL